MFPDDMFYFSHHTRLFTHQEKRMEGSGFSSHHNTFFQIELSVILLRRILSVFIYMQPLSWIYWMCKFTLY